MEQPLERKVIKIEANPLLSKTKDPQKKLRVAAYCRVSTDDEEQINSYEAQIAYYTETIAKNPNWIFAGVYADEGISGTGTVKRKNFLRMMNDCEKGKIDMILTKSISRFARNTVDSLSWTRRLRAMNIGIYFEEQALDSLKAENEMLIGLFSVIAQAESENISANVRWGVQQRMKNGLYCANFSCFGYRKGSNGVPKIEECEAETVKTIFNRFLDGESVEQICNYLIESNVPFTGKSKRWNRQTVRNILLNEKYSGDLLLQKTFRTDPISKKTKINSGELPRYLVSNNHPAIIPKDKFNAVQMEFARRSNKQKRSTKTRNEQGKYSGKFALSELLVCGECGFHYKRTGKTDKNGHRIYYWRCINRMENGVNKCSSIGVEEQQLHAAICRCLNKMFVQKDETLRLIQNNLAYAVSGSNDFGNAFGLEKQILSLEEEAESMMSMMGTTGGDTERYLTLIESNFSKVKVLREQLAQAKARAEADATSNAEIARLEEMIQGTDLSFDRFDDVMIRRLVECVRVMKDKRIIVVLKGGLQAEDLLRTDLTLQ